MQATLFDWISVLIFKVVSTSLPKEGMDNFYLARIKGKAAYFLRLTDQDRTVTPRTSSYENIKFGELSEHYVKLLDSLLYSDDAPPESNTPTSEETEEMKELEKPIRNLSSQGNNILEKYEIELKQISLQCQKYRQKPPIGKKLPPVAGKIAWVRGLFRRLSAPMEWIPKDLIKKPENGHLLKTFNQLSFTLFGIEHLYL